MTTLHTKLAAVSTLTGGRLQQQHTNLVCRLQQIHKNHKPVNIMTTNIFKICAILQLIRNCESHVSVLINVPKASFEQLFS